MFNKEINYDDTMSKRSFNRRRSSNRGLPSDSNHAYGGKSTLELDNKMGSIINHDYFNRFADQMEEKA